MAETASLALERAADYVARRFKAAGLSPAGENGGVISPLAVGLGIANGPASSASPRSYVAVAVAESLISRTSNAQSPRIVIRGLWSFSYRAIVRCGPCGGYRARQ